MSEGQESPLRFPCTFPIKAMGKADDGFRGLVVSIVKRHAPDLDEALIKVRKSSGGKWLAVTVIIEATGREQLDAIYRELSAHERVVWAM